MTADPISPHAPAIRTDQIALEVMTADPISPHAPAIRTDQIALEVMTADPISPHAPAIRTDQIALEVMTADIPSLIYDEISSGNIQLSGQVVNFIILDEIGSGGIESSGESLNDIILELRLNIELNPNPILVGENSTVIVTRSGGSVIGPYLIYQTSFEDANHGWNLSNSQIIDFGRTGDKSLGFPNYSSGVKVAERIVSVGSNAIVKFWIGDFRENFDGDFSGFYINNIAQSLNIQRGSWTYHEFNLNFGNNTLRFQAVGSSDPSGASFWAVDDIVITEGEEVNTATDSITISLYSSNSNVVNIPSPKTIIIPQNQTSGTGLVTGISKGIADIEGRYENINSNIVTLSVTSIYDEIGSGGIELNGESLNDIILGIVVHDEIGSGGIELSSEANSTIYFKIDSTVEINISGNGSNDVILVNKLKFYKFISKFTRIYKN